MDTTRLIPVSWDENRFEDADNNRETSGTMILSSLVLEEGKYSLSTFGISREKFAHVPKCDRRDL